MLKGFPTRANIAQNLDFRGNYWLAASRVFTSFRIDLVRTLGGNEDDYLTLKYALACQRLFIILQARMIRAQLSALGAFKAAGWEQAARSGQ